MIIATKIKLKPTKEQEVLFWKSAGTNSKADEKVRLVFM